ncbi:MAG TPA: aminotransferase class IV, partial [Limnochordia bacterium]
MAGWAVVDGQLVEEERAQLSVGDRGFVLGDSIFTTLVASSGGMFRFDAHWARLERGASLLGIPLPRRTQLEAWIGQLTQGASGLCVVRPQISRGRHPGRGVAVWDGADVPPTVVVRSFPFAPHPPSACRRGVRVIVSPIPKNERSPLLQCKTPFNYGDALIARREARRRGADDALFLNTRGELVSATSANVFC